MILAALEQGWRKDPDFQTPSATSTKQSPAAEELVFTKMLAFARYPSRQTAERWELSRRDVVKAGKSLGRAIFGYRYRDATPGRGAPAWLTRARLTNRDHGYR